MRPSRLQLIILLLLAIVSTTARGTKCSALNFQPDCYQQLKQLWTEYRQTHFPNVTTEEFRRQQETLGDKIVRHSLVARSPNGQDFICEIRRGLKNCSNLENIPYLVRNAKSSKCYQEITIGVTLGYLSEVIFGSEIHLIDPYSFWAALEPFCAHQVPRSSFVCVADSWPSAFVQLWKPHPLEPDEKFSLSAVRQTCLDTRVERVLSPFTSVHHCGHHVFFCGVLASLANKLYFQVRFPHSKLHCNLHLYCAACKAPVELTDKLTELQTIWSVPEMPPLIPNEELKIFDWSVGNAVEIIYNFTQKFQLDRTVPQMYRLRLNPTYAYRSWCQLRNDLKSILTVNNSHHLHCPANLYQSAMANLSSFLFHKTNWTLAGLLTIANSACHRTIQPNCLLRERQTFLANTEDFRSAQSLFVSATDDETKPETICNVVVELVLNFTESVRFTCGKHTAKVACHSLAKDLVEEMFDWRFARECRVNCTEIEEEIEELVNDSSKFHVCSWFTYLLGFSLLGCIIV